jgi:uncharacterized DUF497 family protein
MGRTQSASQSPEAQCELCRSGYGVQQSPGADFADDEHSADEAREIIIGHSPARRLLLVSFTEPMRDRVRIISARPVTKRERQDYEEYVTN